MAFGYKILGQAAPADTSNANAYTVPSGKEAIVSSIAIANVTATDALYEVYVRANGAAASAANALIFDATATKKAIE